MATFGDWKKLPSLSTKRTSPQVKYVASKKNLLCTTGQKHVDLCSFQDGRSQHTWSVRQSDHLTTPAVYDPTQEDFVVVVNHKTLYKWKETTMDILKGRSVSLDNKVHTLMQRNKQEPLLLFEDGRISLSSSPTEYLCDSIDESIVWADHIREKDKYILCVVAQNGKKLEAFVYSVLKSSQLVQPQKVSMQDVKYGQFCLQQTSDHINLLALSNTGDIDRYALTGLSFGEHEKISTSARVGENALFCALDESHVVITETKQTKDDEAGLTVLDLRFNTVKTVSAYPSGTKAAPVYLNMVKDNLFLASSSGVYQCQVSVAESTLGSVLGKMTSGESESPDNVTNLETLMQPLLDLGKTKDYKSFKKAFNSFFSSLKENPNEVVLLQQPLNSLVQRCLNEKQFFPEKELLNLVSESLVPANFCMDAIKKLQDKNNLSGIHSCLIHIKDIPESVTVQCLQYILDLNPSQFPSSTDEDEMTEELVEGEEDKRKSPFPTGKAAFINRVLMIPFSDVFLLESLKKLEFSKCVEVLEYLGYLLETLPLETNKKNNNSAELSFQNVVTWIGLILDAHFTQIIISPDAGRVLVNVQEIIEAQMCYFDGLRDLDSVVQQFLKKVQIPTRQRTNDYCIEKLIIL